MPHVLIIDDDPRDSARLSLTLRSLGFETRAATTVRDAVEALRLRLFDLVVLDVHLSKNREQEGLDVLEQLVLIQPDTPTVVISDDPAREVEQRAWRRGANAYHRKPLAPMTFLHDVIQLCTHAPGSSAPARFSEAGREPWSGEVQTV